MNSKPNEHKKHSISLLCVEKMILNIWHQIYVIISKVQ